MFEHLHDHRMYLTAGVALGTMVLTFAAVAYVGRRLGRAVPLAVNLFVCMMTGALASGFGLPLRHLF